MQKVSSQSKQREENTPPQYRRPPYRTGSGRNRARTPRGQSWASGERRQRSPRPRSPEKSSESLSLESWVPQRRPSSILVRSWPSGRRGVSCFGGDCSECFHLRKSF